jgi:protein-S-isoprenylcysteine O-methyltransferase Ste14
MREVVRNALIGFLRLAVLLPLITFLPAGTLEYWQAWACLLAFFVPVIVITLYLMKADPALLQRRMKAGPRSETETSQKIIQAVNGVEFVAIFAVSGLDHRFRWSTVPVAFEAVGYALIVVGFAMVFWVFRVNSFTAGVIEVAAGQEVITSGPYAIVRHPMYLGALVMLSGFPLGLGSWWGLIAVALMTVTLVWRLLEEERFLTRNLPGYGDYTMQVHYRLAPFIW